LVKCFETKEVAIPWVKKNPGVFQNLRDCIMYKSSKTMTSDLLVSVENEPTPL
jgi:hypothetical protein